MADNVDRIKAPDFKLDPLFQQSQKTLFPFGTDILKGNIPDYFKTIGEVGGQEFEDVVGQVNRDVARSVTETAARRNVSGARSASAIAKATADVGKQLRFEDLTRARSGRESLLNTGLNTVRGVGESSLGLSRLENQFNLSATGIDLDVAKTQDTNEFRRQQIEAQEDAQLSAILSSIIGGVGTIAGGAIGGAPGARIGQKLGSAVGTGVANKSFQLPFDQVNTDISKFF